MARELVDLRDWVIRNLNEAEADIALISHGDSTAFEEGYISAIKRLAEDVGLDLVYVQTCKGAVWMEASEAVDQWH